MQLIKSEDRLVWEKENPGYENRTNAEWVRFKETGLWYGSASLSYADLATLTKHFNPKEGYFTVPRVVDKE